MPEVVDVTAAISGPCALLITCVLAGLKLWDRQLERRHEERMLASRLRFCAERCDDSPPTAETAAFVAATLGGSGPAVPDVPDGRP